MTCLEEEDGSCSLFKSEPSLRFSGFHQDAPEENDDEEEDDQYGGDINSMEVFAQ